MENIMINNDNDINNLRKLDTYCGYFVNTDKLLASASGGAATAISEEIICKGGVVFGATYSCDFKSVEYACITNVEDLYKIKGSKYCETSKTISIKGTKKSVFNQIEEYLIRGKTVLFIGLGCDVGAVLSYCQNKNLVIDNLYCIEILCHGATLAKVHKQYVEKLENKYGSQIIKLNLRYKKRGWTPPYLHAEFKNGKVYDYPFYETEYGVIFSNYARKACYNCRFKGKNHKGDITLGDYWGLKPNMSAWNKNGVSIIFVQTDKGHELLKGLKDDFHLEKADTELALRYNEPYYKCRHYKNDYNKFISDLDEKGITYAVKHMNLKFNTRIKKCIKKILPMYLVDSIKIIISRLK